MERIWKGRQSLEGWRIEPEHEPMLRATVDRDTYDTQSSAKCQAWTAERGWVTVLTLPIEETAVAAYSPHGSDLHTSAWREAVKADLDLLLRLGREAFGGGR